MNLEEINKIVIQCAYIKYMLSRIDKDEDEYYVDNQCNNCDYYIDITNNNKIILDYFKYDVEGKFICINTKQYLNCDRECYIANIPHMLCEEFSTFYKNHRFDIQKTLIDDFDL